MKTPKRTLKGSSERGDSKEGGETTLQNADRNVTVETLTPMERSRASIESSLIFNEFSIATPGQTANKEVQIPAL